MTRAMTPGIVLADRYRIVRILGQGGMGSVYLCYDLKQLGKMVAVKENDDTSPQVHRHFENVATLLTTLKHPNLCAVIDHFTESTGRLYVVMEYIEGNSLDDLIIEKGKSIAESKALTWFSQLLDGVEYLHGLNPPLIHGDIKPRNVLISPHGRAILVDFSIAKAYGSPRELSPAYTPGFQPPEVYTGGEGGIRSEIYVLGATLYYMLTASAPPDSVAVLRGLARIVPPRQINPQISSTSDSAILKAMRLDPQARFQSVEEFRLALHLAQSRAETFINLSPIQVFLIHGHDESAKEAVARCIEKLGLSVVILHEQSNLGKTIIEKLEHYSNVGFAVALLTPDDVGAPTGRSNDTRSRARQNVILELGYFMGKLGRGRVCALYKEGVEIPSDYQGVLYIPMDSAGAWRMALAKEIKNAGIDVDLNKL